MKSKRFLKIYLVTSRKSVHADEAKPTRTQPFLLYPNAESPKEAVPVALQIVAVNSSLMLSPCAPMHSSWARAEKNSGTVKDSRNCFFEE